MYIEKGKEVAQQSFLALSSQLMGAMKEGGAVHAINYCNLQAVPLTDSLSKAYQVAIKRTSDKWRNEKNKPTELEAEIISWYLEDKKVGRELLPKVVSLKDNEVLFAAPILINSQCLKCHGTPADIDDQSLDLLKKHYPNDDAQGYKPNDLRGIWSITFKSPKY
ncbi:DUF3365 domain-containing protein [Flammeovirgaceae bacterium SG7u.111]|nr:DUF3365 domain-containing protein [Flammeovirgaceae bacterium SG7u.132]WPO33941.1 DUF3365 domain-containing protein [Flammeovirgaceae bacterium SG7u.111]